ncbi:unnamed protein product [Amoebophrya sp. A25]|nr:unnamed protein product [Amoebophrya sp. A25]|eukprot:GSA25T00008178001.1
MQLRIASHIVLLCPVLAFSLIANKTAVSTMAARGTVINPTVLQQRFKDVQSTFQEKGGKCAINYPQIPSYRAHELTAAALDDTVPVGEIQQELPGTEHNLNAWFEFAGYPDPLALSNFQKTSRRVAQGLIKMSSEMTEPHRATHERAPQSLRP